MGDFKKLIVYQKAYQLALDVYVISKTFPHEEKFSLTDQIRRSLRSVCASLAEAYRRKKYKPHVLSKLTDSEAENTETKVWIDFSKDFGYINSELFNELSSRNREVKKMIYFMINNPEKFC